MLEWNPKKRITVEEAMKHDFFKELFDEKDLKTCKTPFTFDVDEKTFQTKDKVKQIIYDDIMVSYSNFLNEKKWNLKHHNLKGDAIVKGELKL
jgi:serine/threonine protein kinase